MGIQSYQCFIQMNGQNIDTVNEEWKYEQLAGLDKCIIVKIPIDISIEQIKAMKLDDFKQYDTIEGQYCCSSWYFENIEGFSKDEDEDLCIWKSSEPDLEEYHLVNFEPFSYTAFVQEEYDPTDIPIEFYNVIFLNRFKNMISLFPTLDRNEMYKYIRENKWNNIPAVKIEKPYIVYLNEKERYLILPYSYYEDPIKLDDITIFKASKYMIEPFEDDHYDIRTANIYMHSHRRIDKSGMTPLSEYIAVDDNHIPIDHHGNPYGFESQDIFGGTDLQEEEFKYDDYKEIKRRCTHKAIIFTD